MSAEQPPASKSSHDRSPIDRGFAAEKLPSGGWVVTTWPFRPDEYRPMHAAFTNTADFLKWIHDELSTREA